ncbi:hypothetical protein BGX27_003047 [Mortierella sp. AM989]|nr:hypothetical protein BGX27_003047 [Mortierella sp. AM989]
MGEISNKRRRSLSRHTHYGSDDDLSMSDSDSYTSGYDSSDSLYSRRYRRSRSRRRSSRRKRIRYTSISSDTGGSDANDDATLSARPKSNGRISPDTVLTNDPSDRFSGPMEMITQMNSLMDKCSTHMDKLKATFRKMETINKRFNIEMWEMRKEMKGHIALSGQTSQNTPGHIAHSTTGRISQNAAGPSHTEPQTQQSTSTPRSRNNSAQGENVAISNVGRSEGSRALNPILPPPSLHPVSSRQRHWAGDITEGTMSSGMVTIRVPPNVMRDLHSPALRSTGYKRVFETSNYQLPIASQPTIAVFSIGHKNIIERMMGGRSPRPMKFNPYSYQTRFDGIAATCSVDGLIQFWDINTQEMILSLPPKESRVIPYAEALTWVSEDTIVAVSHLKAGITWPAVNGNVSANVNPNSYSSPETQSNLITLYFNQEDKLAYRVVTITSMPHVKPISSVAAVMRKDHSMSYVTGGQDRILYHWKFHAPSGDNEKPYDPEGLTVVHKLHSNAITSIIYSHISKNLFTGGKDSRYITFNMEHEKVVKEVKLGDILHINQNPVDPRINAVTLQGRSEQYLLMDERTPAQPVLRMGYTTDSKNSKLTHPSWHPEGGLFCSGTQFDGAVNVWDIRWNGIKNAYNRRPGVGVVTGDVQFDRVITGDNGPSRHPIFRKRQPIEGFYRDTVGGPSQIMNLGGKKIIHAGFHPSKSVMIIQNADSTMGFM